MQVEEGLDGSASREQLEATLRVPDAFDAEEPDEKVEAVHQERPEHRSLEREEIETSVKESDEQKRKLSLVT